MIKNKKKLSIIMVLVIAPFVLEAFIVFSTNHQIKINSRKIKNTKAIKIFNGKDISNLVLAARDSSKNINKYYEIKNRTIYFRRGYVGYLRTKRIYSAFKLHAEWKWTEKGEKGNSGILVFIQHPDKVWPECIQINFKKAHAGDLISMNGAKFKEAIGKPNTTELIRHKSSEKPEGKWNKCDIISSGDSLLVYINGVLQNKATKIKNRTGYIGWQMEGKPIALKNIYLIKIKKNA